MGDGSGLISWRFHERQRGADFHLEPDWLQQAFSCKPAPRRMGIILEASNHLLLISWQIGNELSVSIFGETRQLGIFSQWQLPASCTEYHGKRNRLVACNSQLGSERRAWAGRVHEASRVE
jgi:hypothetical protein